MTESTAQLPDPADCASVQPTDSGWRPESQTVNKAAVVRFYIAAALLMTCDNALLVIVIWISLQITSSSLLLGMVICLSVSVPFVLDRLLEGRIGQALAGRLAIIRLLIFSAVALSAQLGCAGNPFGFLVIAIATGMADYFTVNALEAENTKLTLAGLLPSELAAKRLQTAIQTGSFLGALLGGISLGHVRNGMLITIVSMLAGLAAFLLPGRQRLVRQETGADAKAYVTTMVGRQAFRTRMILPQLICLGFIGFHIGAFNTMVPLIYERLHGWDPGIFGMVGGLAGIGALLASVLPTPRVSIVLFAIVIIVVDAILVTSPYPVLSAISAFALGFSINHVRISIRTHLTEVARTDSDAESIGSHSAFYFLCFQAMAPLILTALISSALLGNRHAPAMMVVCGCLLCGSTVITCRATRVSSQPGL
jgi:hypothetical protein